MNRINKIFLVLLLLAILSAGIGSISAADLNNTQLNQSSDTSILTDDGLNTTDTVFVSGNGSDSEGDGTINNPYATIQKGINNTPDGKILNISAGTYNITSPLSIDKQITINAYNGQVIINGNGQTRLINLGSNSQLTMNNIILTGGFADNGAVVHTSAINYQNTFNNCTFINNRASSYGGVFYQRANDNFNILIANSCVFINNSAKSGGIFYGIGHLNLGLFGCIIYNNTNIPYYTNDGYSSVMGYNYWGVNDPSVYLTKDNVNNLVVNKWYILVLSSNSSEIAQNEQADFTVKLLDNDGNEIYSGTYIPSISVNFTTNGGNLSLLQSNITNHHASVVFTPSTYGIYTITATVASGQVLSENITVTKIPLYVSADAVDGAGNGSLDNPYSLSDGLNAVASSTDYDTIKLLPGRYNISNTINIQSNLTIKAYEGDVVISGLSNHRIFNVKSGNTLNLINVTLLDGKDSDGGAIYLEPNSNLNATSCVFRNNSALNGGVIYASNSTNLNLKYNQFANNSADNGLAIYNAGSAIINGDYNWWGQNQGPSRNNTVYGNIIANNWLVVDFNTTKSYLKPNSSDKLTVRLLLNDNSSFDGFIPELEIRYVLDDIDELNYLNIDNNYTVYYTISNASGNVSGHIYIDDEVLNVKYKFISPLDYVFVSVDGSDTTGDGSESNPFKTIEHALIYAKDSGSIIYLKKGIYNLNSTVIDNINVTVSSYDGEVIFDRTNSFNVFYINSNGSLYLNGVKFIGGYNRTYHNAAIYVDGGNLSISNSSFTNCSSGSVAGYIYIYGGNGFVNNTNFTNLYVFKNYRSPAVGLSGENSFLEMNNIYLDNLGLIINSTSSYGAVGGISNYNGKLIVRNGIFNNVYGEASRIQSGANSSFINISISNNHGRSPLYVTEGGILYIINSTIEGSNYSAISTDNSNNNFIYVNGSRFINNRGENGGAINSKGTILEVYNSLFKSNGAVNGGAIYTVYGTSNICGNIFINNTASGNGGSIYSEGSDVIVTIRNNSFNQSSANIGGVIYSNGITTLSSNIMINPNASFGKYIYNGLRMGNTYLKILDNKTVSLKPNTTYLVKAVLTDDMGNPISGGIVILTINGDDYNLNLSEGIASINYTFTKNGLYPINGTYNGSRSYSVIESDGAINITSTMQTVIANNVSKTYGALIQYKGVFYDRNGNPLVNAPANFKLNNVTYVRYTNSNGIATLNINKLKPGTYTITLKNPVTKEVRNYKITVLPLIRNNKNLSIYYRNGTKFYVRIFGSNGQPKVGAKVQFRINGKTYTIKTDSRGYAGLAINLAPKKYTITTSYGGFKVSNTINVLPRLITKNVKIRSGSYFSAKLVDKQGKPMSHIKIRFIIRGRIYAIATNSKGIASMRITLRPGTYKMTTVYGCLKASNTINVLPRLITKNVKIRSGSYFSAKLVDKQGKPMSHIKIRFIIRGRTYAIATNSKGIASMRITLRKGTYTITTVYGSLKNRNKIRVY